MASIRPATIEDAGSISRIHIESWQSTYAGLLPDRVLLDLDSRIHEQRWWRHALTRRRPQHAVLVAEDKDQGVVGFGSCGPSRDRGLPFRGEIYTIYLRDEFQGGGIGKRLFLALTGNILSHQGPTMVVWALKTNPNRFFYQALGGRYVARRSGTLGGAEIEEVAFGWDDVTDLVALGGAAGHS